MKGVKRVNKICIVNSGKFPEICQIYAIYDYVYKFCDNRFTILCNPWGQVNTDISKPLTRLDYDHHSDVHGLKDLD